MSTYLRTHALSIGHGDRVLIRDLDLSLNAGELVSIIGRNGSGKSTLLRTLCGLHPPMQGSIELGGTDLRGMSAAHRAHHIAAVFPGRTTAGQVTVREALAMARYIRTNWTGRMGERDEGVLDVAMKLSGILGWEERTLGTLSDGEYQRVMIGRAIAQITGVILLDEPTAYLDLTARVSIIASFVLLAKDIGRAVLISTHHLQLALEVSDRLLVVRADGTCWQGTPDEAIDSGIISEEFNEAGVRFDPERGDFVAG